jgi:anaerobic selenocysteine-containing dehydrogenase
VHGDDARRLGVADGDLVRVRSEVGELVLTLRVNADVAPGTASIPHGHDVNVNELSDDHDRIDPLTGMTLYSGVELRIGPAEDAGAAAASDEGAT